VLAVGILLLLPRSTPARQGAGILIVLGVLLGAIPSVSGYVSNRYFVVPVVLWLSAGLLLLDDYLRVRERARSTVINGLVMAAVAALLAVLWWPSLPASELRAKGTPVWSVMLQDFRNACPGNPDLGVLFRFTPFDWPQGGDLTEPMTPIATCGVLDY
jgi:uncharacterized membrane protein YhhN